MVFDIEIEIIWNNKCNVAISQTTRLVLLNLHIDVVGLEFKGKSIFRKKTHYS